MLATELEIERLNTERPLQTEELSMEFVINLTQLVQS